MSFGPEEHIENATLREHVYVRHHDSGLPVYFCPKPGFQKRYACFATRFGSIDMSFSRNGQPKIDVPAGVAHFLEHKLFEGEQGNAFELFSKYGASSNAYTGFTVTNYLFSCSQDFMRNLRFLIEFVQEPYFTEENVEKEKGIIGQEINMYDDDPRWQIYMNLLGALYQEHTIREDIAGTVESISHIDKGLLDRCYETFYHPQNMILFGVGDEDREDFFRTADEVLTSERGDLGSIERYYPAEPQEIRERHVDVAMEVSQPQLLMGFKDRAAGRGGRDLLVRELVTDLLLDTLFGRSSGFYQRLYEQRLIDEGFHSSYSGYVEVGYTLVSGETSDPDRLAQEVVGELQRARRDGVSEQDFERQKRSTMGSFFRYFNSLEFIANNYCAYRFCDIDLFDIIDELHGIELAQLNERLESHLVEDGMSISTVRPKQLT